MRPKQLQLILAAKAWMRRIHCKYDAILLDSRAGGSPLTGRLQSYQNRSRLRSSCDRWSPFRIAVNEKCSGSRKQFRKPSFFLSDPGDITKKLKMFPADACYHTDLGLNH